MQRSLLYGKDHLLQQIVATGCEPGSAGAGDGLMTALFFGLLIGLEIKHFVADYLLQPGWILAGKGDFTKPGGYAHAATHALLTALLLLVFQVPLAVIAMIFAAEFVVHYALDYAKIMYSRGVHVDRHPARFWALHGIDQLAHQLTYAGIVYWAALARGLI